ncbi:MAG: trigger factor [Candidatus Yanofskybacteria bacterium RIFCSPHIGHO2_02_FULL_39_10]|uniref:Trigger factor n=1 Tax=Candidatus Yanofskybacteria bacterium RIFCSPHIGHO2_02_FULL_39_10 TaxID=1802674 RepID=A0A1F8F4D5_9BACT|nr:MAG: trigger factor [Candidatus Yanofskybacteria bacterium RIFCSPHIGHO2_02_FULL_39_10]
MNSTVKKIKQNNIELTVELGREELDKYVQSAEDQIVREVQIDGFRKGKASKDAVRKKVGNQYILETALDIAVHDSLEKAIEKDKLEVLKMAQLEVKENSPAKLVYKVVLTIFPKITLVDISDDKIQKKDIKVEQNEINEAIDFICNSRAKFLAKDGVAEKGDRVEVDFEVTSEGLPVEGGISKNHPLVIGDNKFIPGFEEQIIGMKSGTEKKFSLIVPKDYFHKAIAGKEIDFEVKVIAVQKIEKPNLDDDFARSLGRFSDLDDFKNNVKEGILQEKKTKEKERLRLDILSRIADKSSIELPQDMVDEQLNVMIASFDNELHQKGMELSIYLAHLNKTQEDLKKDWQAEAEKQVKFYIILRKVAQDNHIQPSEEEIEQETGKLIQVMVARGQLDQNNINIEEIKNSVSVELIKDKTMSFLEEKYVS